VVYWLKNNMGSSLVLIRFRFWMLHFLSAMSCKEQKVHLRNASYLCAMFSLGSIKITREIDVFQWLSMVRYNRNTLWIKPIFSPIKNSENTNCLVVCDTLLSKVTKRKEGWCWAKMQQTKCNENPKLSFDTPNN